MGYNDHYSPEFQNDLDNIADYIVSEFCDPDAAERITNGILNATEILAEYPESGRKVFFPNAMDSGYRFVVYRDYVAVYRFEWNEVYVVRAVNTRQDYMRELFPWLKNDRPNDDDGSES